MAGKNILLLNPQLIPVSKNMFQDMFVESFSSVRVPEYQLAADPDSTRSEVSDNE